MILSGETAHELEIYRDLIRLISNFFLADLDIKVLISTHQGLQSHRDLDKCPSIL